MPDFFFDSESDSESESELELEPESELEPELESESESESESDSASESDLSFLSSLAAALAFLPPGFLPVGFGVFSAFSYSVGIGRTDPILRRYT